MTEFAYDGLDQTVFQIRLLQIYYAETSHVVSCSLASFDFHNCPPYRALSYAWGQTSQKLIARDGKSFDVMNPSWHSTRPMSGDDQLININGKGFNVRENLWHFMRLVAERQLDYGDQHLWIDQICINQKDSLEKGNQVSMMDVIFWRANQVLCWLGAADHSSSRVMEFLKDLEQQMQYEHGASDDSEHRLRIIQRAYADEKAHTNEDGTSFGQALLHFFARSYWSRLWVVQEIYVAKETIWICGTTQLHDSDFRRSSKEICLHWKNIELEYSGYQPNMPVFLQYKAEDAHKRGYLVPKSQHRDLLSAAAHLLCEDPRDYVYALAGIVDQRHWPTIDYTRPTAELFCEIFRHCFEGSTEEYSKELLAPFVLLARKMQVSGREEICKDPYVQEQFQSTFGMSLQMCLETQAIN